MCVGCAPGSSKWEAAASAGGAVFLRAAALAAAAAASAPTASVAAARARPAAYSASATAASTIGAVSAAAAENTSAAAAASEFCCAVEGGIPRGGTSVPGERVGGGGWTCIVSSSMRRDVPAQDEAPVTGVPGRAVATASQVRFLSQWVGGTTLHGGCAV